MSNVHVIIQKKNVLATILTVCFTIYGTSKAQSEDEKTGKVDDYNQWKQALGTNQATDPRSITVPPGFAVELLRSAQSNEGSWISLTFDPRGRIIVAREDRGLLRITPPTTPNVTSAKPDRPSGDVGNSLRIESIDDSLLECRGLLWAYNALYANANNSKAFYRLPFNQDSDQLETPQLLRSTPGHVGHGRNDLALGPDGHIYLIHGDDVFLPTDFQPERSPLRNYSDDRLLPCSWDEQLFNSYMKLPGGHVVRTDRDGKKWELVAGGLRNPYGLDFNADGELFTFDADMEWDVGMPWYRPTRALHLVSGADYGWRRGTGTWRAWYPDSLMPVVDVGLGSPTAVKFGTRSHFPAHYQRALFILDWAYGRILAVHLAPKGATYTGKFENFVTGRPLNVTDTEFGPDGAMYFLTGGRKTQSGLYRVRYVGPNASGASASSVGLVNGALQKASESRELRRRLESFHGHEATEAIEVAWAYLDHEDPAIRHAARVAIEHQPISSWRGKALEEQKPMAAATALLALARLGLPGDRDRLLSRLKTLSWDSLSTEQRLVVARSMNITLARHGFPDKNDSLPIAEELDRRFPDPSPEVNQLLCELLVAFKSPKVVPKTLKLIASAKTQEEKFHYLVTLRHVPGPWERRDRRRYLTWLQQASDFYGAQYLPRYLQWLKSDVAASLAPEEQQMFADALKDQTPATDTVTQIQRQHVRNWQLDDLAGSIDSGAKKTSDLQRGKETFSAALCIRCHRMGLTGSPLGPDLTEVSRRFGRRDLLLAILAPSHVIDEKYQATTIVTHSGKVVSGQVTGQAADIVTVTPNLLYPETVVRIPADDIESQTPALTSTMPAGLLNTFTKDEILDLLAYIESGGK